LPSHQQNYETWNNSYDWNRYGGDEWSAKWGGADMQWYWCLLPRIQHHLPAHTILDIGPGFGRWTKYLMEHCEHMILVDISEKCINACRRRFGDNGITYRVGPGASLDFLQDESIDFAFSWEALVYVESDGIDTYLNDLSRKLKADGTAFLHHSNLAAFSRYFDRTLKIPKKWRNALKRRGMLDFDQWRARTVTAESFAHSAKNANLHVQTQEIIPWGGKRTIDCLTTLSRRKQSESSRVIKNPQFHTRAYDIQRLSWLYGEGVPW
jgi:ubiquinone/menaquinone biosynthesis C-methylase UbiE